MLIKWRTLGLALLPTMLIHAEFSFEDIDFDNLGDSEEFVTQKNCKNGNIFCLLQKNTVSPLRNEAFRTEDEDIEKQFNSQSILSVLSLLTSLFPKGETDKPTIIFNIRDIQTGFHNSGKNYHIGNIQREVLRSKRETGDDENENLNENENTYMSNDSSKPDNSATNNVDNTTGFNFENEIEQDISYSNTDFDTNNFIEHTTMTNSGNSTDRTVSELVFREDSTENKQIITNSESSNTDIIDIYNKTTDVYPSAVLNDTSYTNVPKDHTNNLISETGNDLNDGNAMNINRIYSKSNSTPNATNDLYNETSYENTTVNTTQSLDILQFKENEDFNTSDILNDKINFPVNKFSNVELSEKIYTSYDDNDSLERAAYAETETNADKSPEPFQYSVTKPNAQTNDISDDQLKELQTVLDKELGIDAVNYAATKNFSFTITGSNSKSNQPFVVIVYNCNCENNAVETNKNNIAQSNDVNNNIINKNNNHSYEYFYKYWRMVPHNSNLGNLTNKTLNTHLNPSITMEKLLQCQTLLAAMTKNISAHTENVDKYSNRNRESTSAQVLRNGNDKTEDYPRTEYNDNIKTLNKDEANLDGDVSTHDYIDLLTDGLKAISRAPILNYIPVPKAVGTYYDWRRGHSNAQYNNNHILKNLGIDLLKKREVDDTTMNRYMDNEPIVSEENSMNADNKYFKYDVNDDDDDDDDIFNDVNRDGSKADSETRIATSAFEYDDDSISTTALIDKAEKLTNKKERVESTTKHNHNKNYDDSSSDSDDYSNYYDDNNHEDGLKIKITVLWDNHKLTN